MRNAHGHGTGQHLPDQPGPDTAIWIVAKPGGYEGGRYELPMFGTYFDEAEARTTAVKAKAVLARLPVVEDHR